MKHVAACPRAAAAAAAAAALPLPPPPQILLSALCLPPATHPTAVLDRAEYVTLRQELAELKAEAATARGGSRAGQRVSWVRRLMRDAAQQTQSVAVLNLRFQKRCSLNPV